MSRYVRLNEILAMTGLAKTTLHRMEAAEPPRFPRRRRLGARAVAWDLEEIEAWLRSRPAVTVSCADAPRTSNPVRPV